MPVKSLRKFEEKLQDYLEQLKVVEYTRTNRVYQSISKLLTSAINELGSDISELRRGQLNILLRGVATKQKVMLDEAMAESIERQTKFGAYSYQIEASLLAEVTGANILHATKARAIFQAALARPLGATGDLLEPFIKNLSAYQTGIVEKTVRKAYVNGWTSQQTLQVLKGTRANQFKDGLMSRLGKQTSTVIRTSMQHINNSARQTVWAENSDIVIAYRWVSTLDDRTSDVCQDLDGEEFKLDEGPLPPAHPNCRSTTVAVLDPAFDALDRGATRSSAEGYIDVNITYPEWLAGQEGDE